MTNKSVIAADLIVASLRALPGCDRALLVHWEAAQMQSDGFSGNNFYRVQMDARVGADMRRQHSC